MPQHAICSYFLSLTTPAMHALTPGNRGSSMPCDAGTWWRWQTAPRQTTVLSSSVQTTAVTAVKTDTIRGVVCPPCFDVTQFPPSPHRFPRHANHHLGACKRSAAMFPSSQRSEIFQSSWSLTPSSFLTSSAPSFSYFSSSVLNFLSCMCVLVHVGRAFHVSQERLWDVYSFNVYSAVPLL